MNVSFCVHQVLFIGWIINLEYLVYCFSEIMWMLLGNSGFITIFFSPRVVALPSFAFFPFLLAIVELVEVVRGSFPDKLDIDVDV